MPDELKITEIHKYLKKLLEEAIQKCREKGKLDSVIDSLTTNKALPKGYKIKTLPLIKKDIIINNPTAEDFQQKLGG